MRSLVQSLIQRFNWVEKFDFSSVLQLLAVSTNSVIRVRIVLEFLRQQSISISIDTWDRSRWWASSKKSYLYNERQNEIAMSRLRLMKTWMLVFATSLNHEIVPTDLFSYLNRNKTLKLILPPSAVWPKTCGSRTKF